MNHCCVPSVPHADSSYETFARPLTQWQARLTAGLSRSLQASQQNLGDLEEEIVRHTGDLERRLLEEAAQKKAAATPPRCPVCGHALRQCSSDQPRTFQSRFGPVTIKRLRGWCRRCRAWRFPADHALGLSDTGGASPSVQEMAALTVSKMPVKEASAVIERLTGVTLPPATLDREARRQGQRAERKRKQLDAQMGRGAGAAQMLPLPEQPFTLARALYPDEPAAAARWMKPMLKKLQAGRVLGVLADLRGLAKRLRRQHRQAVAAELAYLESHRGRMDYGAARRAGEPIGSGPMEATCRQYPCRFKRTGQFWSRAGDEALMCLETFWRNQRWHVLFPHILHGDPHNN